jgi:hypothetical protein
MSRHGHRYCCQVKITSLLLQRGKINCIVVNMIFSCLSYEYFMPISLVFVLILGLAGPIRIIVRIIRI